MEGPSMKSTKGTFTSSEIIEITSNFKAMIGKGGFGEVYFGTLKDGTDVAVKILLSSSEQCRKTFQAEAKLLTAVHHENLVSLVGYCDEDGKEALIYDYMPNGNLKQNLSGESKTILQWNERLQIALDVAYGLEYLHSCKPPIVHGDLKPDNILFNENMQAKIADFGLSKAFTTESASHISTHPGGTPGYIDLESWNIGRISKRSDVYSFGIILLELVTGKPAVIEGDTENWVNISNWIDPLIGKEDIQNIVDRRLNGEFNINAAHKAIKIAVSCVKPIKERPDISHVVIKLVECLGIEINSRVLDETSRTNVLIRLYRNMRPNKNRRTKGAIMKSMEKQPMNLRTIRLFSYSEVAKITSNFKEVIREGGTSNFKEVIREGGFGKVYLGTLTDDTCVAVKVLSTSSMQGYEHFRTEVELLSHLYHRNVVSLVGYCDENDINVLIYEYMANGNLKEHLSEKFERILCWNERLKIAIDIAYGLEYLQMCCKSFIVHRNLKPDNILLTESMQAKIGDFGLATILDVEFDEDEIIWGTFGYVAPEYFLSGEINKKTDLYSFGIILLELLTGRPPFIKENCRFTSITDQVRPLMGTGDTETLVDPRLQGKFNISTAWKVAKLGMLCASDSANQRPDISHVLIELKECLALEMLSQQTEGGTNRHGRITKFR